MKRKILSFLLCGALMLAFCGCDSSKSSLTDSIPGDSSRTLYFSETHFLSTSNTQALFQVTVDRVLEHCYSIYSDLVYVVVLATVDEVFHVSQASWFSQGDRVALWINTNDLVPFTDMTQEEIRQATVSLQQIIRDSDHLIVQGWEHDTVLRPTHPEHQNWLEDTEGMTWSYVPYDEESARLDLPPGVYIPSLTSWDIMPFQNGRLETGKLTELIDSVGSEMAHSLDTEYPKGGQYFKTGDSLEDVADALRTYVKEYA